MTVELFSNVQIQVMLQRYCVNSVQLNNVMVSTLSYSCVVWESV